MDYNWVDVMWKCGERHIYIYIQWSRRVNTHWQREGLDVLRDSWSPRYRDDNEIYGSVGRRLAGRLVGWSVGRSVDGSVDRRQA